MKTSFTTSIELMGFDFYAMVEIEITHWGCPAKLSGPPENCYPAEAPEWFITSITLQRDEPGELGAQWEIDGALFNVIGNLPQVQETGDDAVSLEANERYLMQRQMRRRRAF